MLVETEDLLEVKQKMLTAAAEAANTFLQEKLGGKDNYPCGFAWVSVKAKFKGNTREGRAERAKFAKLGLEQSYTSPTTYQMWNPSKNFCQNVYVKEAGAEAAAKVLREHGFNATVGTRWD